jgi:hypothetical protein
MNRLSTSRQGQAVSALVEGSSINGTCRMIGIAKHTVLKLLQDLGERHFQTAALPRLLAVSLDTMA